MYQWDRTVWERVWDRMEFMILSILNNQLDVYISTISIIQIWKPLLNIIK